MLRKPSHLRIRRLRRPASTLRLRCETLADERSVMQPLRVMTNLIAALTNYVSVLEASAEHTTRAEDRSVYTRHLAEAARMFAALQAGEEQALRERIEAERRTYGWGYLSGEPGAAAEAAFDALADRLSLESR